MGTISHTIFEGEKAGGSHDFQFNIRDFKRGNYNTIEVSWTIADTKKESSKTYRFNVLGKYRHTQYNSPAESACSGTQIPVYITTAKCGFTNGSFRSQFKSQVDLNGSGIASGTGPIQIEASCLGKSGAPEDAAGRSYRAVGSLSGPGGRRINSSTIAICPGRDGMQYGDRMLIVGLGSGVGTTKFANDRCPACCKTADDAGQNGHVDNYNDTTQACTSNGVGDLGNYLSVKLID